MLGWFWERRIVGFGRSGGLQTFSVNSAYNHVRKDREVVSSPIFSRLWRCKVVPSDVLTAWRMLENKLATRVNLERRGVLVENFVLFVWEGGRVSPPFVFRLQFCLAGLVFLF